MTLSWRGEESRDSLALELELERQAGKGRESETRALSVAIAVVLVFAGMALRALRAHDEGRLIMS